MRSAGQRVSAAMAIALGALAAAAGACGGARHAKAPTGAGTGSVEDGDGATGLEPDPGADDGAPLEERIAAIEHAMNDLAPVANQCWAAAAADDLHVEGAVRMLVKVARDASAKTTAEATLDEPRDPVLVRCLADVLAAYAWAPPMRGQEVELPFAFRAPAMQNVIDRRLVPHHAQAGVDVAVLLDELNTANPAISLVQVAIDPGAKIGPRLAERTELWVFLSRVQVAWQRGTARQETTLGRGDAFWVEPGARVEVSAAPSAPGGIPPTIAEAIVAFVPGGREGSARAGALPSAPPPVPRVIEPPPTIVPAADGHRYPRPGGAATIQIEPATRSWIGTAASLTTLELDAGAVVPPHVHAGETEVLYVVGGGGSMTVGGVTLPVTEDSVIQIPPGVEHSFTATDATVAFQLYTPAGPEQRFKKPPPK